LLLLLLLCRSQWPRGLKRRSAAARLLGLWVRSHRGHGCLCCVCCKGGSMERKVTWRTEGFKQYKNGSKGKNPRQTKKKKIPPGAWMSVCCECCVLSGRGVCDEQDPRPEESYRVWRVLSVWSRNLEKWGGLAPLWGCGAIGKKIIFIIIWFLFYVH
jgi:hypothetical protein